MNLIICDPDEERKIGRPRIGDEVMTAKQRKDRQRATERELKLQCVAVLDMETDRFNADENADVKPFCAVLHSDNFEPIVVWENDPVKFVEKLMEVFDGLPDPYTIYAHNGGKFDFMFLIHRIRGRVSFKGRGIMSAKIGRHEIRDSYHLIPEKLANYKKDDFDYTKLDRKHREKYKDEIIQYCKNDCKYLLDIVKSFLREHGFKISIGQAAMYELRKFYNVKRLGANSDAFLRNYFFGGRVECLQGRGRWRGKFKLIDVNSMYPDVMANEEHPIGNEYICRRGKPGPDTVFLDLNCRNRGALVKRGENNETSANIKYGRFFTTIHEYRMALKYGLIDRVQINNLVDCRERSNFSLFVIPKYEKRIETKPILKALEKEGKKESYEYNEIKKDDMFTKYLLNNAYGKFAQNPRRFKESYITDIGQRPPEGDEWGDLPIFESREYAIWERPALIRGFNNVGTAASITGAARAKLMEAIQLAVDPIYCDTDSLICRDVQGIELHPTKLGAWDLESEFEEVIICGKKLYACKDANLPDGHKDKIKIRSKGASGLVWGDFLQMLDDQIVEKVNKGVTMTKRGDQFYMRRKIRATAPVHTNRINSYTQRANA